MTNFLTFRQVINKMMIFECINLKSIYNRQLKRMMVFTLLDQHFQLVEKCNPKNKRG